MSRRVLLKRTRNRRQEHLALVIMLVLMVGVMTVWLWQTKTLFSTEAMEAYRARRAANQQQFEASFDLKTEIEDQMPLLDDDPIAEIEQLEAQLQPTTEDEFTLDMIATQMLNQIRSAPATAATLPESPNKEIQTPETNE